MVKYIKVDWPDTQNYEDHSRYNECYDVVPSDCSDDWSIMVPEDLYDEVMYKLEFPKKYENTNLGTIVCYETRAIVNGEDIYWYDWDELIKRRSKVLLYNHGIEGYPEWIIAECKACSVGFPILFTDDTLLPDINCEIIGVKQEENLQNKD